MNPENGLDLPEANGDKGHLAAVFISRTEVASSCALDGKQESVQKLLPLSYTSNL